MNLVEESNQFQPDFKKLAYFNHMDVLPVVVQHFKTKDILILAYVNELALNEAIRQKKAVFWSTSRNELWVKGATSGDFLQLNEVRVNCEQNSLLYLVTPVQGGVCHTKDEDGNARLTCFYRRVNSDFSLSFLC